MKIVYLIDVDLSKTSGIIQKIRGQAMAWIRLGHTVNIITLRSEEGKTVLENSLILNVRNRDNILEDKFLYINSARKLKMVLREIKPDLIYMRYLLYRPYLVSTIKASAPYIVELNADDVEEFKTINRLVYYYNNFTRDALLKNASGFIAVTNDIGARQVFTKYQKKTIVIGNSVDVDGFWNYRRKDLNANATKKGVFVGSPNCLWHGVDKVIKMAELLPNVDFTIIGLDRRDFDKIPQNLTFLGYLKETEVKEITAKFDFGISTLALHRSNLTEACPLKSRQYLAQGIPIIMGYEDPDIDTEQVKFVLNIGNYEHNVINNIDNIKEFIDNVRSINIDSIVAFAKGNLDVSVKEKKRIDFMIEVSNT